MQYSRMLLYSILERGGKKKRKKKNFVHVHVCVHVFTMSFIAKVDLPELYKAAS